MKKCLKIAVTGMKSCEPWTVGEALKENLPSIFGVDRPCTEKWRNESYEESDPAGASQACLANLETCHAKAQTTAGNHFASMPLSTRKPRTSQKQTRKSHGNRDWLSSRSRNRRNHFTKLPIYKSKTILLVLMFIAVFQRFSGLFICVSLCPDLWTREAGDHALTTKAPSKAATRQRSAIGELVIQFFAPLSTKWSPWLEFNASGKHDMSQVIKR